MSPRAVGLASAALSALTACSVFFGDFNGYTDPDQDPAPSDGGGGTDGGGADGPASGVDGSDASTSSEASTGFCLANGDAGVFCEDFDGIGDPIVHFDRKQQVGGTISVDSASFFSAPKSMLVEALQGADPGATYVAISAKQNGAHARLELKARVDEVGGSATSGAQFAKVWFFPTGGGSYEVGFGIKDKAYVYEFSSDNVYREVAEVPPLPPSGWHHLVLDVRIGNGARVDLDVDGTRVVDNVALQPPYDGGTMEAAVGLPYFDGNHGAWKLHFDDILYSVPP